MGMLSPVTQIPWPLLSLSKGRHVPNQSRGCPEFRVNGASVKSWAFSPQTGSHGQQRANQLWQWQLAIAGKGFGKLKMPRIGSELKRVDALNELGEKSAKG